jgi:hypothetical protein
MHASKINKVERVDYNCLQGREGERGRDLLCIPQCNTNVEKCVTNVRCIMLRTVEELRQKR